MALLEKFIDFGGSILSWLIVLKQLCDEERLVVGEIAEGCTDGVFYGGYGGVSSGGFVAAGGGDWRRRFALFVDSELHVR